MSIEGRDGRGAAVGGDAAAAPAHEAGLPSSVLQYVPDFLCHVSLDGRFLFLNKVAEGISRADVAGKTIYDFSDPRFHDTMRSAIDEVVRTRAPTVFESLGPGPNYRTAHYFTRVAPVVEEGFVRSVVLIATDVTRLKEAEAGLRATEAKLLHVLSATGMGTWWSSLDGKEGGSDAACAQILGFAPDENVTAEMVMSRIPPADRELVLAGLAAAEASGSYGPIEHRVVHADGRVHWVSASARVFDDESQRRILVGGVVDITGRKRLEAQLAQAQKMESIGRLAGGIAHDFNNMLTIILSYGETARAQLEPGSSAAEDLIEVQNAAERSRALTKQLLAFARQQIIEPRVVDLSDLVLRVENLLRRILGEDIEVATVLEATRRVRVDPNQFEQVLLNLATNARDAMPQGGRLTIETRNVDLDAPYGPPEGELPPGSYVLLAVSDSGTGIAPKHLPHVFEPFFTTKDRGKGTGLGLATCYGIVAQNRGTISVYSELGSGTTFKIHLPAAEGPPTTLEVAAPKVQGGTETILVVEDEPMVRALNVRTLRTAGYRVLEAANGVDALSVARAFEGEIALLVTDVIMPQMSGKRLAAELSTERPGTSVLYVSGYTDNSIVHHGVLDAGIDFLSKPFTPQTLLARVRAAIDAWILRGA
jgi:PAS domain S-box-containing protein